MRSKSMRVRSSERPQPIVSATRSASPAAVALLITPLEHNDAQWRQLAELADSQVGRAAPVGRVDREPIPVDRRPLEAIYLEDGMPGSRQSRDDEEADERRQRGAQHGAFERRNEERRHRVCGSATDIQGIGIRVRVPLNGVAGDSAKEPSDKDNYWQ